MLVCKMTILWVRPKPTYFTNFSSKLQKITKFSKVILVNKTRLYWNIIFTIIYIDKFMTKYSKELSEVYVRNRGIALICMYTATHTTLHGRRYAMYFNKIYNGLFAHQCRPYMYIVILYLHDLVYFARVCVLFRGKRGTVCGKRLIFLYTSPYEHVEYNVSGP